MLLSLILLACVFGLWRRSVYLLDEHDAMKREIAALRGQGPQKQASFAELRVEGDRAQQPSEVGQPLAAAMVPPPPPAAFSAPSVVPAPSSQEGALEYKFGSKIFTGIGGLAVLLGTGFFLQYAIQAGLLSESMRVALGVVGGIVLVALGMWLRGRYFAYAQVLVGTGLGVWHLSNFASFNYYHFIGQDFAYIIAGLITAIGVWLAVMLGAQYLALYASLGGLLAPLMFGGYELQLPTQMFVYLLILNAGLLTIARFRSWRDLELVSFFGTILWYVSWFGGAYSSAYWTYALVWASVYGALFLGVTVFTAASARDLKSEFNVALPIANASFVFGIFYAILNPLYPDVTGGVIALLGIFHILLGSVFGLSDERTTAYRQSMIGMGLALLAIAIPIQFKAYVITMLWSVKALVLVALGFQLGSKRLRQVGSALAVIALSRFVLVDLFVSVQSAFLNDRFLPGLVLALCLGAISYLYWSSREGVIGEADEGAHLLAAHAALLLLAAVASSEVKQFYGFLWLPLIFTIYGFVAGAVAILFRDESFRIAALGGYILSLWWVVGVSDYGAMPVLLNTRTLLLLILALAAANTLVGWRSRMAADASATGLSSEIAILALLFHGSMLALISLEITTYFTQLRVSGGDNRSIENMKQVSLSVAWLLYALLVLVVGIWKRLGTARVFGISLCALVIAKVFLYDSLGLSSFYRFISFMTLGVILLLVGYLYNRYKAQILEFIRVE
ncbi:MAG: DUF2339 domain-containing protein [Patescibacteria group bacterium]